MGSIEHSLIKCRACIYEGVKRKGSRRVPVDSAIQQDDIQVHLLLAECILGSFWISQRLIFSHKEDITVPALRSMVT